ncbi:hypothetical protein RJ639_028361 [Escallonia herrerae]|uniref:FAR1 domain-containing protein n=1 Tax=Escallonia herrerae TaxID=1293975 RepID=A0AA88XD07_9ASTE|nr:hypothetical protein RJ639_028361 [Escallonia herrerae]
MDIGGCSNTLSSSSMGKADDNEQELDYVCTMQSCQSNVHGGKVHEVPTIGMEFDSEQYAFDYYSEYAHRIGFSVRKQHVKKRAGIVARRTLCCSKEGNLHETVLLLLEKEMVAWDKGYAVTKVTQITDDMSNPPPRELAELWNQLDVRYLSLASSFTCDEHGLR